MENKRKVAVVAYSTPFGVNGKARGEVFYTGGTAEAWEAAEAEFGTGAVDSVSAASKSRFLIDLANRPTAELQGMLDALAGHRAAHAVRTREGLCQCIADQLDGADNAILLAG